MLTYMEESSIQNGYLYITVLSIPESKITTHPSFLLNYPPYLGTYVRQTGKMKLSTVVLSLATSSVLALPTAEESSSGNSGAGLVSRQTLNTITDQLLYSITLPAFETRRNNRDPSNLDWSSDGCSTSPDNPFGFPFVPACHRHDFGYRNYKIQSRFTDSGKLKVDNNFKTEYVAISLPT